MWIRSKSLLLQNAQRDTRAALALSDDKFTDRRLYAQRCFWANVSLVGLSKVYLR